MIHYSKPVESSAVQHHQHQHEVTQDKEIQAELSRARRLDTIGTLASGIAHDFNNALMVISAQAELGIRSLDSAHPLRRNLEEIAAASRRASGLTRQLLHYRHDNTGGVQIVLMNAIVEDVVHILSQIISEDIEIRLLLGNDVGLVRSDAGQIEQVLLNLAVNARDAMPNGGSLVVETRSVRLEGDDTPAHTAVRRPRRLHTLGCNRYRFGNFG